MGGLATGLLDEQSLESALDDEWIGNGLAVVRNAIVTVVDPRLEVLGQLRGRDPAIVAVRQVMFIIEEGRIVPRPRGQYFGEIAQDSGRLGARNKTWSAQAGH